jgi:adenine-specific DNA-methyltransferase
MNTLNYIGCKNKLFDTLYRIFESNVQDLRNKSFSDRFMGTGIISFNMVPRCASILANDLEDYSYIIGNAILKCNYSEKIEFHISECNQLEGIEGLIYKYYSPHPAKESVEIEECERMFFTNDNAKKADAMRVYIQEIFESQQVTQEEYYFLIASLLVSIDKVANTTSVYGAYLKQFKASSLKPIVLEPIHQRKDIPNIEKHTVISTNAEKINVATDVTYLDPPYNQRSYSANYFVLNFIARYDKTIVPYGKTGLIDKNQSDFCSKVRVKKAFQTLFETIKSTTIFLSYNNEGILDIEDMKEIALKKGDVKLYKIKYNKYKSNQKVEIDYVYEYLWVIFSNPNQENEHSFEEIEYV